jgi:SAM-dependent methyltransferase
MSRSRARRAAGRVRSSLRALTGQSTPSAVDDPRPRGWWDLFPFTNHRIRLASDLYTLDGDGVDPERDVRTAILCEHLGDAFGQSSIVDLGCLEGAFSIELGRRGARQVLGIEARQRSVDRCELVRDLLGLTNVEFRCADIDDELARWPAGFDAVLATGILYHLPDPAASLKTIRAACRTIAVIDTHVAVHDGPTHFCSDTVTELRSGGETYRGRMFWEFDASASESEQQAYVLAAYGNPQSFWPFEDDLVRMMADAGFGSVSKLDPGRYDARWQVDELNRVMYLCRP